MTLHAVGDQIGGRYEVTGFLGEGGMQEVYAARDLVLERAVALKVPKNNAAERRFKRSATLSAKVSHPNAAKTLDYIDGDARPYLVEELIEGQDLYRLRERLPIMDPYLVAHVLHHVARGVAASHHVSVVHRDLKPSNIMLSAGLAFDVIKVTDFGIAKMAEEELAVAAEGGEESITGSQTMMGALPYLSPEMIKTPRSTGTAADVWAIGAICYELMTGTKPFGTGLLAVPKILAGTYAPLPTSLRKPQLNGLLSDVFALIERCLVVDPAARVSADDLVQGCGKLCYPPSGRREGVVSGMPYGSWGFIDADGGSVFFHTDSVYGPSVSTGDRVCFADFPGDPQPRAHPVVKLT